MNLRELFLLQQVKDEPRIAPIILLSPLGYPPDLGSVADKYSVVEALDEFDELGAVTASFNPDDHFTFEGGIEATDIIPLVIQLSERISPSSVSQ